MKDPLFYMTTQIKDLEHRILALEAKAQKWMNVAGLMHDYLLEQDAQSAQKVYEETAENGDVGKS